MSLARELAEAQRDRDTRNRESSRRLFMLEQRIGMHDQVFNFCVDAGHHKGYQEYWDRRKRPKVYNYRARWICGRCLGVLLNTHHQWLRNEHSAAFLKGKPWLSVAAPGGLGSRFEWDYNPHPKKQGQPLLHIFSPKHKGMLASWITQWCDENLKGLWAIEPAVGAAHALKHLLLHQMRRALSGDWMWFQLAEDLALFESKGLDDFKDTAA